MVSPIFTPLIIVLIIVLIFWEAVWKGIALWKAGNQKQLGWFIALFVLNTLGILPIVYIWWFQNKSLKHKK
jgi:hypothetical protein